MAIKFSALVTSQRRTSISGNYRFSPNIPFLISGLEKVRFGFTTLDHVDWPLNYGDTKLAHFTMFGVPEFRELVGTLKPGVNFSLLEGAFEIGHGIIEQVEECKLDD